MIFNKLTGDKGENYACVILKKRGLKILECNFRTSLGEIDIIARDGEIVVFVEVKTRSSKAFGDPQEAVNTHKQKTIRNVALCYLKKHKMLDSVPVRFDCVALFGTDANSFDCEYFENAF